MHTERAARVLAMCTGHAERAAGVFGMYAKHTKHAARFSNDVCTECAEGTPGLSPLCVFPL
eukprot:1160792-Pelagomonas_calceolata.AAC.6